jgi:hypothetical protein
MRAPGLWAFRKIGRGATGLPTEERQSIMHKIDEKIPLWAATEQGLPTNFD